MGGRSLANTIDFAKHDFSLLLVDPKPEMVEWVRTFIKKRGLERYRLYYPEGNLAVIVPLVDLFSIPGQFEQFVDRMKPRLLEAQLSRYTITPEDFGHPVTKETFDRFFFLSLRESALLMSDFKDAEELCMIEMG